MHMKKQLTATVAGIMFLGVLAGCSTPHVSSHGQIQPDQDIITGGMGSSDIRTMASKMCPEILALPEVVGSADVTRIAISPMKNSSRFIIDMNIFMKKLRLDLNRYSQGQVRFFSQNNGARTRTTLLKNRREKLVDASLDKLADQIVGLPIVTGSPDPVTVAVLPVLNVNFVNMNANSFTAMLRAKVAERSNGKVLFTMPGSTVKADYLLTGQFIADGMKQEGIVNLVDYIDLMEDRMEKGQSLDLYDRDEASVSGTNHGIQINAIAHLGTIEPSLFRQLQVSAALRAEPNVTKRLSVMLVDAGKELAVFEKMIVVEQKITDGTQNANFILSGEISGLSKRQGAQQSDYVLMTMQLTDPLSNEIIWEDGYEVKRSSVSGTVYQ